MGEEVFPLIGLEVTIHSPASEWTVWVLAVRVPTDAHRLNFVAYVLRYDCAVDCILTKIDANGQISRGEPVSAEVARVNMRCD